MRQSTPTVGDKLISPSISVTGIRLLWVTANFRLHHPLPWLPHLLTVSLHWCCYSSYTAHTLTFKKDILLILKRDKNKQKGKIKIKNRKSKATTPVLSPPPGSLETRARALDPHVFSPISLWLALLPMRASKTIT